MLLFLVYYSFSFCIFGSYSSFPVVLLFYGSQFSGLLAFLLKYDDDDVRLWTTATYRCVVNIRK